MTVKWLKRELKMLQTFRGYAQQEYFRRTRKDLSPRDELVWTRNQILGMDALRKKWAKEAIEAAEHYANTADLGNTKWRQEMTERFTKNAAKYEKEAKQYHVLAEKIEEHGLPADDKEGWPAIGIDVLQQEEET